MYDNTNAIKHITNVLSYIISFVVGRLFFSVDVRLWFELNLIKFYLSVICIKNCLFCFIIFI